MELRPSEPQAFCVEMRRSGATVAGSRVVPLTPVQTASDCEITCSISVRRALAVWFCVRVETGLVPRVVLQRTEMLEAALRLWGRTGQAEPPDPATGLRPSGPTLVKAVPAASPARPA